MKSVHGLIRIEIQHGKLVYSNHKGFKNELPEKYKLSLKEYYSAGQARFVSEKEVEKAIKEIKKKCDIEKSDDPHILGLAKAENVTVLCTKDKDLHNYFTQVIDGGRIYQNKSHKHLLTSDLCA